MYFCSKEYLPNVFEGKSVAIVGSGPGVLDNEPGFVDSKQVVVRVNNHKTGLQQGLRTDVHYSFYGSSIRKNAGELKAEGVKLCMCKCPNAKFMNSIWHERNYKPHGVDFRYIYRDRADWWFCQTYVPMLNEFMAVFNMLDQHIPSTGFSAIVEVLSQRPASIFLTGFDFFSSGIHNVSEPWRPGNPADPIGHAPELERAWLAKHGAGITMDKRLTEIMKGLS